jgi:hypothetical protein
MLNGVKNIRSRILILLTFGIFTVSSLIINLSGIFWVDMALAQDGTSYTCYGADPSTCNGSCPPGSYCRQNFANPPRCGCFIREIPFTDPYPPCASKRHPQCSEGYCSASEKCVVDLDSTENPKKCICIPLAESPLILILTPTPTATPTPTPSLECNGLITTYTAERANSFCADKYCDNPNAACKVVLTVDKNDGTGTSDYHCGCVTPTPTPTPIPCRGFYTGFLSQQMANRKCNELNASCRSGVCSAIQPVVGGTDSSGFTRWICGCAEDAQLP